MRTCTGMLYIICQVLFENSTVYGNKKLKNINMYKKMWRNGTALDCDAGDCRFEPA